MIDVICNYASRLISELSASRPLNTFLLHDQLFKSSLTMWSADWSHIDHCAIVNLVLLSLYCQLVTVRSLIVIWRYTSASETVGRRCARRTAFQPCRGGRALQADILRVNALPRIRRSYDTATSQPLKSLRIYKRTRQSNLGSKRLAILPHG
jgi:hypothetical protein